MPSNSTTLALRFLGYQLTLSGHTIRNVLLFSIGTCIILLMYLAIDPIRQVNFKRHRTHQHLTSSLSGHDASVLTRLAQNCVQPREIDSFVRYDVWYVMTEQQRLLEVSVFSAFLDDRDEHQFWLRLLAVSNTPPNTVVFCQIWYTGIAHPVVSVAKVDDTGRGTTRQGTHYQEQLYSCALPVVSAVPNNVSLAFGECQTTTASVPIQRPQVVEEKIDIGICVAVAYGRVEPDNLVEWIEFNRLLGIGEINVYSSRPNREAIQVLRHYNQSHVVRWQVVAPPVREWCLWCQKLSTIAVINDCLYRNMYRYQYLAVIDFDELLIPRRHNDLLSALQAIKANHGRFQADIMFKNAYFFREFPHDDVIDLSSMTYVTRLKANKVVYAPKSVINPRMCIAMQNHYCILRTENVRHSRITVASEDDVLLHHYKNCHFSRPECEEMMQHPIFDNSTLRFMAALLPRVQRAMIAVQTPK